MNVGSTGGGRSVPFVRRNRVDERVALGIGLVAGLATVPARAQPTGSATVDVLLTALSVAFVTWAGASAPWWAPATLAGVAAALAMDTVPALVGAAGFALGLWIGVRRRDAPQLRAAVTAIGLNVALWSTLDEPLGLVPAVMVPLAVLVTVLGLRRRPSTIRRIGRSVLLAAGTYVVIATALMAASALSARRALTDGSELAREAIDALDRGEYDVAATTFAASADRLTQVDRQLTQIWAAPARLVPVVAQNRAAAADLAAEAERTARQAADALEQIDLDALRVVNGAVDLDALAAVEQPLTEVLEALDGLEATIGSIDSPWVAGPVQDRLGDLAEDIDQNGERLDTALLAVQRAPGLLGADGERRYLVIFTTPSETRGLGGFPGNYAEVTADEGRIELTAFGRISDLEAAAIASGATCGECPEEFVSTWGAYGFTNGPGGAVGTGNWRSITAPAHFPYVGEVSQVLYPQSGGAEIDGVLVVDPYVVERFVAYTGPVEVPALGVTIDEDNALSFLLFGQYLTGEPNTERIDALETIGVDVITDLLSSPLPNPAELADDLGPLVAERRLLFWTDDPGEQELLDDVGLLGAVPDLGASRTGFSVAVANSGGNKIDAFLRRDVVLSMSEPGDGSARLVAEVTLHNDAPTAGLPANVIGNSVDRPDGTSRLLVAFYGPDRLRSARLDGRDTALETATEAGWTVHRQFVDIPARSSVTYRLEFDVPADGSPALVLDDVATWEQPIVRRPSDRRPHDPSD